MVMGPATNAALVDATVVVKSDDIAYLDITYFENEYASATRSLDQIVISRPSSQSNKFDFVSTQDISPVGVGSCVDCSNFSA